MQRHCGFWFSCFLTTFWFPIANGQTDQLKSCVEIDDESKRLACYDAFSNRPTTVVVESTGTTGKWTTSVKVNPIDDTKTVTLVLIADSGKSQSGRKTRLVIRCQSNSTELYMAWGDYLGSEADVTTRIGDSKAKTRRWSMSGDKQGTFYPRKDTEFILNLMTANKFVARVTPYNESPITAVFDTFGFDAAVKPVRETCNW